MTHFLPFISTKEHAKVAKEVINKKSAYLNMKGRH
jgi:hypothetical protein